MHAFDVLGDPVRRRIVELVAESDALPAGEIAARIGDEFGISQPAVLQHLRILRESGSPRSPPRARGVCMPWALARGARSMRG